MAETVLTIATAGRRTQRRWKNQDITWTELCERLKSPVVTQETVAEYTKMSRARQTDVKDVGGFVGGYLAGGHRRKGSCEKRFVVTLDADTPEPGFWLKAQEAAGAAACLYSTHSHTPGRPKFRLLLPLNRPAAPDEYCAVALKLAEAIGLKNFDPTTYQSERLFFWPSRSQDAEYVFQVCAGDPLNVDAWLARYPNWRDTSCWPDAAPSLLTAAKKQDDPLTKPGFVGAFCRAYSIPEAVSTFLSGVYTEDGEGRYTYKHGSTAAGLVVYEDGRFAYSHHGTDPAGGLLLNAFDLVRVHLFSEKDEGWEPRPGAVSPSFKAMRDFASEQDAVRLIVGREKIKEARAVFGLTDEEKDATLKNDGWLKGLAYEKSGAIAASAANIELILENDPLLAGKWLLDTFAIRVRVNGDLPWDRNGAYWTDADDAGLRVYFEKMYGIAARGKLDDAFALSLERRSVHPVREYLDSLAWDGKARLDTLLIEWLGAEDTPYTRMATRKFCVAAVARVFVPGIKFDNALVTTGPQGIGKTLLVQKLGGQWFSNSLDTVQGKEAYEALQGAWLIEIGEMNATRKADIEAVKQFISKTEDSFRVAYGRRKSYFPRQCVFWGTSNDAEFLRDRTGNRRYWPVACSGESAKHPGDMAQATVDQIWAEAVHYYRHGENLYLTADESAMAQAAQEEHTEESPLAGVVVSFLEKKITEDWYRRDPADRARYIAQYGSEMAEAGDAPRKKVCTLEVWVEALGQDIAYLTPIKAAEIRAVLAHLPGWEKRPRRGTARFGTGYGHQTAYWQIE
jgi:predicted P-loop ATPase